MTLNDHVEIKASLKLCADLGHTQNQLREMVVTVLGQIYRGLSGGFLLFPIFSVAFSVSPHVCFILD